jgi:hypothetical protein
MVVIQGWFCKPKRDEKKELYRFLDVFLTEEFTRTFRRFDPKDLVLTGETKFVGGLLDMQEVWQVVSLKDEFNPFYVTGVVKTGLASLLSALPRRVIV